MNHIERHASASNLTVVRVAQHLGMNSTYLGHLFADQVSTR